MRLPELLLLLTPFIAFLAWRITLRLGAPPRTVVLATSAVVVLAVLLLVWLGRENTLPPHTAYVPAQLQNGRVIPGHGRP